jgi:hypothetical protein
VVDVLDGEVALFCPEPKLINANLRSEKASQRAAGHEKASLGKPQSFISAVERGQRRIDVLELARFARAIGVEPGRLFAEIVDRRSARSR